MNESLTKVTHSLEFAERDLRDAMSNGSSVEFLVVLPMVERLHALQRDVKALIDARESDGVEG